MFRFRFDAVQCRAGVVVRSICSALTTHSSSRFTGSGRAFQLQGHRHHRTALLAFFHRKGVALSFFPTAAKNEDEAPAMIARLYVASGGGATTSLVVETVRGELDGWVLAQQTSPLLPAFSLRAHSLHFAAVT